MLFDFIQQHYNLIVLVAIVLVEFIILVCKKKIKVIDCLRTLILEILPDCINQAEAKFGHGHGEEKLAYVIQLICKTFADRFGSDEYEIFKLYHKFIESSVKNIMKTPKSHN